MFVVFSILRFIRFLLSRTRRRSWVENRSAVSQLILFQVLPVIVDWTRTRHCAAPGTQLPRFICDDAEIKLTGGRRHRTEDTPPFSEFFLQKAALCRTLKALNKNSRRFLAKRCLESDLRHPTSSRTTHATASSFVTLNSSFSLRLPPSSSNMRHFSPPHLVRNPPQSPRTVQRGTSQPKLFGIGYAG
jgi:hypothetical protein